MLRTHLRLWLLVLALCTIVITSLSPLFGSTSGATISEKQTGQQLYILRVSVRAPSDVARLTSGGWDVLEARGSDYLLVLGDDGIIAALRAQGFTVTIDQRLNTPQGVDILDYYGGYRTVEEHYAHMDSIAAAHPELAAVVDYGDSWLRQQGRNGGHDLKVICITKLRPGDCGLSPETDKPRFFLMAAIHARELTTAEMAWRLMDLLVSGYNSDPDITAMLDATEVWIVPVTNPDGRLIVEQGGESPYTQRKNADDAHGRCQEPPSDFSQYGVDLNRNASFKWGPGGSSARPCNLTYRGLQPASEPEESALEGLMRQLFRDQRGPADSDPAPLTTSGAMLTLHSYGNLVILPWGFPECNGQPCPPSKRAPNDQGLRSFAFRMSYFNGYETGQGSEILYATTGTTDDWSYGELGIPSFTFEIGPNGGPCSGFFPNYACQDSTFWPINRDAFLYAAKNVRQPYISTLGPSAGALTLSVQRTTVGVPVTLTANISDAAYGENGISRPAIQHVAEAEYYIDVPPWAGGTAIGMSAQDGAFDSATETVSAQVSTLLNGGRHTLFVRGRDADGNWGATSAQWLYIDDLTATSTPTSSPSTTATASTTPTATTQGTPATPTPRRNLESPTPTGVATSINRLHLPLLGR